MTTRGPVVTVVGGGAFAPRLCESLAEAIALPELDIRLTARDPDRLRVVAEHSARRLAHVRPGWTVSASPALGHALESASIVLLLARIGGLPARMWDETFPRRFGLVGDEGLGAGGIANAWRTLPELARIAREIRATAPGARVINLMAPLGMTTRLLLEHGLEAYGVCELPLVTLNSWLARSEFASASATWRYAGLNHLGWFWDVRSGEHELLPDLARLEGSNARIQPIDQPTLTKFGAAPLRYFYEVFDQRAAARLGLTRRPRRAGELIALSDALLQQFAAAPGSDVPLQQARPTPWLDLAAAPIVSALLGGPSYSGFVNVRNGDAVPELSSEQVIELAATITAGGATLVTPGPIPRAVADFLRCASHAETLTYCAARQRDRTMVEKALRALPLSIPQHSAQKLAALARRSPWSTANRAPECDSARAFA